MEGMVTVVSRRPMASEDAADGAMGRAIGSGGGTVRQVARNPMARNPSQPQAVESRREAAARRAAAVQLQREMAAIEIKNQVIS